MRKREKTGPDFLRQLKSANVLKGRLTITRGQFVTNRLQETDYWRIPRLRRPLTLARKSYRGLGGIEINEPGASTPVLHCDPEFSNRRLARLNEPKTGSRVVFPASRRSIIK